MSISLIDSQVYTTCELNLITLHGPCFRVIVLTLTNNSDISISYHTVMYGRVDAFNALSIPNLTATLIIETSRKSPIRPLPLVMHS